MDVSTLFAVQDYYRLADDDPIHVRENLDTLLEMRLVQQLQPEICKQAQAALMTYETIEGLRVQQLSTESALGEDQVALEDLCEKRDSFWRFLSWPSTRKGVAAGISRLECGINGSEGALVFLQGEIDELLDSYGHRTFTQVLENLGVEVLNENPFNTVNAYAQVNGVYVAPANHFNTACSMLTEANVPTTTEYSNELLAKQIPALVDAFWRTEPKNVGMVDGYMARFAFPEAIPALTAYLSDEREILINTDSVISNEEDLGMEDMSFHDGAGASPDNRSCVRVTRDITKTFCRVVALGAYGSLEGIRERFPSEAKRVAEILFPNEDNETGFIQKRCSQETDLKYG